MTKLVTFLGRRTASANEKPAAAPSASAAPAAAPQPLTATAAALKSDIELDQDLFFPAATQLGAENETVRNLLIDAEHKIGELELIKNSIGKLVDPVSKTLRAYEETKNEKLSLQNVLNTTRIAQNKLREDLANAEKKARTFETESLRLRDILAAAQQTVAAHEKTKAEQLAELVARRSQIAELQRHVQTQSADLQQSRDENRRNIERVATTDRRMVQLEGEARSAQQKAMQSLQECAAVQRALDTAHSELALNSRRLTESDKTLTATQNRLSTVEASLADAQADRQRLSAALDEALHKHRDAVNMQNSRFESLQARANLTENLLEEARQALTARADEIRSFERRVVESTTAHSSSDERIAQLKVALEEREDQIREFEQSHSTLHEHNQMLRHAVAAREATQDAAHQKIQEQADLVELLEKQLQAARSANEMQLDQLHAQLQREQLERSMAEGALESGRKDIARLLREVSDMQQRPNLSVEDHDSDLRSAA
jgi:chromosome segregation ATPase